MPDETDDLDDLASQLSPDEIVGAVAAQIQPDPTPEPSGGTVQVDMTQARAPDAGRNWGSRVRAGGNLGQNIVHLATPGGDVIASGLRYEPAHQDAQTDPMRAKTLDYAPELVAQVLKEKLTNSKVSLYACLSGRPGIEVPELNRAFRVTAGPFRDRVVYVVDSNLWNALLEGPVGTLLRADEPGFVFGGEGVSEASVEGFVVAARERYG